MLRMREGLSIRVKKVIGNGLPDTKNIIFSLSGGKRRNWLGNEGDYEVSAGADVFAAK